MAEHLDVERSIDLSCAWVRWLPCVSADEADNSAADAKASAHTTARPARRRISAGVFAGHVRCDCRGDVSVLERRRQRVLRKPLMEQKSCAHSPYVLLRLTGGMLCLAHTLDCSRRALTESKSLQCSLPSTARPAWLWSDPFAATDFTGSQQWTRCYQPHDTAWTHTSAQFPAGAPRNTLLDLILLPRMYGIGSVHHSSQFTSPTLSTMYKPRRVRHPATPACNHDTTGQLTALV